MSFCINGFFTLDCVLGNDDNLAIFYSDITHTVEVGLGVHDPAVVDHDIVGFSENRKRHCRCQQGHKH